jgi:hypothetical protein
VRARDGTKFKGHTFNNGAGRNRADLEGEMDGTTINWTERLLHIAGSELTINGKRTGDVITFTFRGHFPNGVTTEGKGELHLESSVTTIQPIQKSHSDRTTAKAEQRTGRLANQTLSFLPYPRLRMSPTYFRSLASRPRLGQRKSSLSGAVV